MAKVKKDKLVLRSSGEKIVMRNTNFYLRAASLLIIIAAVLFYNGMKRDEELTEKAEQLEKRMETLEEQQQEMLLALQSYYEEREEEKKAAEEAEKETKKTEEEKTGNDEDLSDQYYADGNYTGEAEGFGGTIQVEITLEKDTLTNIAVTSAPGEDSAYLSQAQSVIQTVLQEQSTDVDTVSGATFSSTGILNAIDDALAKAEKK